MRWRKSSYSANNGDCVEVAWLKSSFSGNNGECVEVASLSDRVAARDSKNSEGPVLSFGHAAWTSFLRTIGH